MARFYREPVAVVENEWNYLDYVDRREYMWLYEEIQDRVREAE